LLPRVRARADGGLALEGEGFRAELSADRRQARLEGPVDPFPVTAVVRVLLADSLFSCAGLLVHGCAVAHQGKAALFTGVSGAGKSTLGKWASQGGLTLLADELVAVLPDGDGFSAHGTPWNVGTNASARLTHIGVLAHTPGAHLKPVPASTVLRVLLSNVLEPGDTPEVRAKLFQIASKVLSAVPTYELGFAPNLEVAAVLRDALSK
jgi:hypothetical protein